jgi:hypothetical protein
MARSGFRLQGSETGEVGGEGGRERGRWDACWTTDVEVEDTMRGQVADGVLWRFGHASLEPS